MWFKGLDCLHQLLNEPEICLHRFWLYYWRGLIVQWWPLFTMNECWCRQNRPSNFLRQIGPNKAFSGQLGSNQGLFWSELTQGKLSLGQNWPKYMGFLGQTWQSGSKTVTLYSNQDRTISVSGKRVGLHIAKTHKKNINYSILIGYRVPATLMPKHYTKKPVDFEVIGGWGWQKNADNKSTDNNRVLHYNEKNTMPFSNIGIFYSWWAWLWCWW